MSAGSFVVVDDVSLLIDAVGVKIFEGIDLFSVVLVVIDCCGGGFVDGIDDILIEPIDIPLLVVTSSN